MNGRADAVNGESGTDGPDDEIRSLETFCEQLEEAIDEFEHEARRCRDRLERGGESHRITRELKRLRDNRDLNRAELDRARRRLETLKVSGGRGDA